MARVIEERVACPSCGKTYSRSGMGRHLLACLGPGVGQLLAIESGARPKYWLFVRTAAGTTLADLDALLRDVWLECCGHLSRFEIGGQEYPSQLFDDDRFGFRDRPPPKPMTAALASVLPKGARFVHDYDFGSTTRVTGRALGPVAPPEGRRPSVLLRNPMPHWTCDRCGKAPVGICSGCFVISCEACQELPCDCAERWTDPTPIVNSPRMGVCGYVG